MELVPTNSPALKVLNSLGGEFIDRWWVASNRLRVEPLHSNTHAEMPAAAS